MNPRTLQVAARIIGLVRSEVANSASLPRRCGGTPSSGSTSVHGENHREITWEITHWEALGKHWEIMVPSYFRGSIGKQLGEALGNHPHHDFFESEMVRGWMIMAIMLLWRWPWPLGTWMISKFMDSLGHSILRKCQLMVSHIIERERYIYIYRYMYMCNLNISQPSFMIKSQGLSTHRCKPPFCSLTTLYHILALDC